MTTFDELDQGGASYAPAMRKTAAYLVGLR